MTSAAAPMIGGMICPPDEAVASIPAAKVGEKPRFLIIGMVKVPVPTMLATVLPDMVPNREEARIAACAGPPRVRRVARKANFRSVSPAPVPSSSAPKMMKMKTVESTMLVIEPKTPLLVLYHSASETSFSENPECSRMPGRSCPNRR